MRHYPRYPMIGRKVGARPGRSRETRLMLFVTVGNVTLTAIAVVLSGIAIYYSVFRVSDGLQARPAWTHFASGFKPGALSVQLAIVNTGNRQGFVTDLFIAQITLAGGMPSAWQTALSQKTEPELPLLIQPGEIRMVKITAPYSVGDWYRNAAQCDSTSQFYGFGRRCANLGISWNAVNSKGETFTGQAVIARMTVDEKSIKGFERIDTSLNLFANRCGK